MKKKDLEIQLEKLEGFPDANVSASREQYMTPAPIAAELLYFAFLRGEISGTIYDLGCGTGILAIGAKLLGADNVIAIDNAWDALMVAKRNSMELGAIVNFICCDINDVRGKCNTVIMNPPFGAQRKRSDRPFLRKAFEIGPIVYSIHNAGSIKFIEKFIAPNFISHWWQVSIPIKRTFTFHRKDVKEIEAEIYRMERYEG